MILADSIHKFLNGEGEIRTPGGFSLIRFQVGRNRPLCHLSSKSVKLVFTVLSDAIQALLLVSTKADRSYYIVSSTQIALLDANVYDTLRDRSYKISSEATWKSLPTQTKETCETTPASRVTMEKLRNFSLLFSTILGTVAAFK